jgi:hypothetical protein
MTITPIAAHQALSGHWSLEPAAVQVETYWWHLDALHQAPARERAAHHVQALAAAAAGIAAALSGTPGAAPGTRRDPAAWAGISAYLTRLAMALRGGRISPQDRWDMSDGDYGEWEDLAGAVTRLEFAAAWHPVRENLLELAALPDDGGGPRLRGFTAAQVIRAAAAIIDGPW